MTPRWIILAAPAILAGCAAKETAQQSAARMASEATALRPMIDEHHAAWVRYVAAGQADSMRSYYARNARVMGMNEPITRGADSIAANYRGMMQAGTWHFTLTTDSVWANGPLVIATGKWTYHLAKSPNPPPPGMPAIDTTGSGNFMQRWIQEDGTWKLADDIYNSDQPLPAPPPARGH